MEKEFYVYEWIRLDTNEPFYVGKGKNGRAYDLANHRGNKYLKRIIDKLGPDNIAVCMLIENVTEAEAHEYECWYIHEYKYELVFSMANITDGGEGVCIANRSDEWKQKQAEAKKGKKHPKWKGYIVVVDIEANSIEKFETYSLAAEYMNVSSNGGLPGAMKFKTLVHNRYQLLLAKDNEEFNQILQRKTEIIEEASKQKKTRIIKKQNPLVIVEDLKLRKTYKFKNQKLAAEFLGHSRSYISRLISPKVGNKMADKRYKVKLEEV